MVMIWYVSVCTGRLWLAALCVSVQRVKKLLLRNCGQHGLFSQMCDKGVQD